MSYCQDVKVKIQMDGEQLGEVSSFKYLGVIMPTEGSSYEDIRVTIGWLLQTWYG